MIQTKKQKHLPIVIKKLSPFFNPNITMWSIPRDVYKKAQLSKIFSKIRAVKVTTLVISSNEEIPLMKDIQPLSFPYLRILDLTHNYIESIECIHRLEMPILHRLFLDFNLITNIQSFRKCFFFELIQLNLIGNRILSIRPLYLLYSESLRYLDIKMNRALISHFHLLVIELPLETFFMCIFSDIIENSGVILNTAFNKMIQDQKKFPLKKKFTLK